MPTDKKGRKFILVEIHPVVHKYLYDLADDTGASPSKIMRLCIDRALPEIEALLRSDEPEPFDTLRGRHSKPIDGDEPMTYIPRKRFAPPIDRDTIDRLLAGVPIKVVESDDEPFVQLYLEMENERRLLPSKRRRRG